MPKILIVEDELPIADLIRLTLKSAGYLCDHAPDGDQAADLAAAGNYDLALVDVMLPRTDGFTLLEYFQSLELPVIFVTARSAVADRVKGLKLGAEDYIVKPFDVAELLARVETVLRRFHKTEETLSLAGVRVDPRARKVWRGEEEVSLTPKEYDLLLLFLHNPNAALYRDTIYERVWGGELAYGSKTVDLHV
ncbi:MAG: response regulator transcription factor [Evtepia gabavorous]